MITTNDCMTVLVRLEDSGIAVPNRYIQKLALASDPPLEVLKFIAENHGMDIANFYEHIRKNYNAGKSPLYINIVKEHDDQTEVLITLSCLLTQALLYSKKLPDAEAFMREARLEEITRVLNNYFKTYDLADCLKLLKLVRADLMVLEYISGHRELAKN